MLEMKLSTMLQFGDQDERGFRAALSAGGMARDNEVLEDIGASKAEATLCTNLEMAL